MSLKVNGLSGRTLIYFSPVEWNGMQQRPHHLPRVMAHSFKSVIFVQPAGLRPISFNDRRRVLAWIRFRKSDGLKHPDNLHVCTPVFIPLSGSRWADKFNCLSTLKRLRSLLNNSVFKKSVLWTSTPAPLLRYLVPRLSNQYLIYDWIDDYSLFKDLPSAVMDTQKWLLQKADFVFASSMHLYEKACVLRAAETVGMLSNGVDLDHWCLDGNKNEVPEAIANIQHPIIGYFGTISHWLDTELIESVSRRRPEWHFLFIGPAYKSGLDRILGLPNIHWIGEQPYELLPCLADCFDAAWLPFRLTPKTKAINPVKVYEYLALGKRVVAPSLPDLKRLGPYVIPADGLSETESAILRVIRSGSGPEDKAGCRAVAAEFSWDRLWDGALQELAAHII